MTGKSVNNRLPVGPGQRSQFLLPTKRSAASRDEKVAGANDVKIVRNRDAQCNTEEPLLWMLSVTKNHAY